MPSDLRFQCTLLAFLALAIASQACADEVPSNVLSAAMNGARPKPSQISPEATKTLPAEPRDRGDLMPLHAASVLSWLCGDTTVQSRLGLSKSGCYQELWPVVSDCAMEMQEKAPTAHIFATEKSLDVVSFRAAFRQCLAQKYATQQQAKGIVAPSIETGEPDPLAARMTSKSVN